MVKFYYDSQTKKIIDYIETTFEVATAEERPPEPAQAIQELALAGMGGV